MLREPQAHRLAVELLAQVIGQVVERPHSRRPEQPAGVLPVERNITSAGAVGLEQQCRLHRAGIEQDGYEQNQGENAGSRQPSSGGQNSAQRVRCARSQVQDAHGGWNGQQRPILEVVAANSRHVGHVYADQEQNQGIGPIPVLPPTFPQGQERQRDQQVQPPSPAPPPPGSESPTHTRGGRAWRSRCWAATRRSRHSGIGSGRRPGWQRVQPGRAGPLRCPSPAGISLRPPSAAPRTSRSSRPQSADLQDGCRRRWPGSARRLPTPNGCCGTNSGRRRPGL